MALGGGPRVHHYVTRTERVRIQVENHGTVRSTRQGSRRTGLERCHSRASAGQLHSLSEYTTSAGARTRFLMEMLVGDIMQCFSLVCDVKASNSRQAVHFCTFQAAVHVSLHDGRRS